ncbi:MAG: hypothetical protein OXE96_16145 [Gemmatimonadetes bacterium]|nr:hypothetical protein [Gemmatimonadota bacterium]
MQRKISTLAVLIGCLTAFPFTNGIGLAQEPPDTVFEVEQLEVVVGFACRGGRSCNASRTRGHLRCRGDPYGVAGRIWYMRVNVVGN